VDCAKELPGTAISIKHKHPIKYTLFILWEFQFRPKVRTYGE
jgi:hypothetical protein